MTGLDAVADLIHGTENDTPQPIPAAAPAPPRGRGRPRKAVDQPIPGAKKTPEPKVEAPPLTAASSKAIEESLSGLYALAGVMLMPIKPDVAFAVSANAGDCAHAWVELAKTNPGVQKALLSLLKTSAWGGLAIAHMPIILAITTDKGKPASTAPGEVPVSRGFRVPRGRKPPVDVPLSEPAPEPFVPVRVRPDVGAADF
jgi:hypothetical protein